MKKLYIYITLVLLSILTSCVEDINPDFEFEEQVFISGLLTSEEDYVSVQIQKTTPVTDTTFSAINDVQVSLFTKNVSNTASLVSDSFTIDNGNYRTSEMITPIIGNTYWIEVMLQDQTVIKSEEEILKPSIPIIDMVKNGNTVRVTFKGPIEEQNFYLIRIEVFKGDMSISDEYGVFNDRIVNEVEEKILDIGNIKTGETVRVSLHNINFTTFQFYANVLRNQGDEPGFSSLFPPINIVGNITNTITNELILGNFGIAGFSTMTMDF
ncbi:uncharacterized protein DUF4249 [Aquimarina sp. MAR_2010_214]|uniref:DUF4249 family protein n=1 Tax=Aquimarina sp. MAR_2010_214 TaxID=1250026 RepID=UPI000C7073E1|nr:DUF4249 family protein [Aquimarina sp. MAR_2010_214]PKV48037.1 uncharacterized protein DUF4249 [Aquimarina sp. MAR_2010_214]